MSLHRDPPAGLAHAHATEREAALLTIALQTAQKFLSREVDPRAIDRAGTLPRRVIDAAASAGLFALTVPEAYGGAALSLKATCRVVEALARVDRSVAIMVGLHAGLGTRPLVEFGSSELRARFLPELASGERVAAFAATEPEAGSDLTAVRTTGSVDGDELVLEGEKAYVTNGGFAGVFTVLARTPGLGGARAVSLVLVPRETPGVFVGPEEDKLGVRGSSTVAVTFDRVRVPQSNVLGAPGGGLEQAHQALSWGRTIMAAGCVGTARAALEATLEHVRTRRQFGRRLGAFPAVRAQVSEMAAKLYAMESLVRLAGERAAAGESIELEATAAKVFCSESAFDACDRAVQLHGAQGFLEPFGVARLLRDCRITRIFEGANDVLLVRLGVALVAERREGGPEALPSMRFELRASAEACDALGRRLFDARDRARVDHGLTVVHRQLVLQRLARAEILHRASVASLRRALQASDPAQSALAEHAVWLLTTQAERCLDEATRGVADEARVHCVSEQLYGSAWDTPRGAASREARR